MSNAVSGQSGSVNVGGTVVEVVKWDITPTTDHLNATSMSSGGWKEGKLGLKGWSGNFETRVWTNFFGSSGVGSFYVGTAASSTTPVFSGTVLFQNNAVAVPHDNLTTYNYTFTGSGSLTITVS